MAKRKLPVQPGLPPQQFDQLKVVLLAALEVIASRAALAVRKLLANHATDLAQCNLLQLQELESTVHGSYGLQIGDAIRKAVMLGRGQIAPHIYFNDGITWAKLSWLSAVALTKLNDPKHVWHIATGSRNKVVAVPSAALTKYHARKLIRRWVKPAVLPATRQHAPRRKPLPHAYYSLVDVLPDPVVMHAVIAVFRLGNSQFKARLTPADVGRITVVLSGQRKRKIS